MNDIGMERSLAREEMTILRMREHIRLDTYGIVASHGSFHEAVLEVEIAYEG